MAVERARGSVGESVGSGPVSCTTSQFRVPVLPFTFDQYQHLSCIIRVRSLIPSSISHGNVINGYDLGQNKEKKASNLKKICKLQKSKSNRIFLFKI